MPTPPRCLTVLTLFASPLLGCSSSSSGGGGAVDITGTWRLCDAAVQMGGSDPYVAVGGMLLDVTVQQGVASASQIGGDGGPVSESIGWIDDGGFSCDGGSCGSTDVLLSGPFDPGSRVWTAGFLWPHRDDGGPIIETYPARLTFSADGTRFTGIMDDGSGGATWSGGREDGSFTCGSGSGGSGAASNGNCTGLPVCGSPPHCATGCYLQVAVVAGFPDTCAGAPEECSDFQAPQTCNEQQGCTWQ